MAIDILLASYNGEKFIKQQIDSILAQTNHDWRLLIRDDGSTDKTIAIIDGYEKKYPGKIIRVDKESAENLGYTRNFARLMERSSAEHVMFADQDDIWHRDKIEKSLAAMHKLEEKHGKIKPLMVHSDCRLVYESGKEMYGAYHHRNRDHRGAATLATVLMKQATQGCTMMVNRPLLQHALPFPAEIKGHDLWVGLVGFALAHVTYIDEPLMDYRRHANTVTDVTRNMPHNGEKLPKFQNAISSRRHIWKKNLQNAAILLKSVGGDMPPENRQVVENFIKINEKGYVDGTLQLLGDYMPEPKFNPRILAKIFLRGNANADNAR